MSESQSLALEREFNTIMAELGGDAQGRAQGQAYLESTHVPAAPGKRSWGATPRVLSPAEVDLLAAAAKTMGAIMEKVCDRYRRDPAFRELFDLSPELERLSLLPTGYGSSMTFVRFDVAFDGETGDYRFCGVASDSPTGMTASVDVMRAVQRTEAHRRFADRHDVRTFDLVEAACDALTETYRSWANADAGTHHPDRPVVGIVDYPEDATPEECADLVERMAEKGVFARCVNIRDLRIELGSDGIRRLVDAEGPIACVYRRALQTEMALKPCEGADALVEAAKGGLACVVNGFGAWPVSTNRLFAILRSDAMEGFLTLDELAFVREHTPESYVLGRGSDLGRYLAERDAWVVRPAGTYTVRDVVAGLDCSDADDWWRVLLACAEEGGVVQAYDAARTAPVYVGGNVEGVCASADPVEASGILGLYLFRGEFAGVWARAAAASASGQGGRIDLGCVVVGD